MPARKPRAANTGNWVWPSWCLKHRPPGIEVLIYNDTGSTVWVKAKPQERIVDPQTGKDTHLNAHYYWDGDEYTEDFGPDRVRRCGETITVAEFFTNAGRSASAPRQ